MKVLAAVLVAVLGAAALAGCTSSSNNAPGDDAGSSAAQAGEMQAGGSSAPVSATAGAGASSADAPYTVEAGDTAAANAFILENGSSNPVFGIEIKPAASEDEAASYEGYPFTVGDRLGPDMRCLVHFDAAGDRYDLLLRYADGTECELLDLELTKLESPLRVELSADGEAFVA